MKIDEALQCKSLKDERIAQRSWFYLSLCPILTYSLGAIAIFIHSFYFLIPASLQFLDRLNIQTEKPSSITLQELNADPLVAIFHSLQSIKLKLLISPCDFVELWVWRDREISDRYPPVKILMLQAKKTRLTKG